MPSSAVVISLAVPWQLWYYHKALCHLSDGDRKAWMCVVCSQHHAVIKVIKHKRALLHHQQRFIGQLSGNTFHQKVGMLYKNMSKYGTDIQKSAITM